MKREKYSMSMAKFLDPKNDVAFKKIFGEEASKPHLISFLNSVLTLEGEKEIKEIEFLNPYQAPRIAGKKISFIDVLVTDQRNIRYVVEMQIFRVSGFEKRAQYYAAKTYVSQNEAGGEYPKLNQVYFLGIADHVMFPDKTSYKSDHLILDHQTYEHDLKDISFTFIELPKFTKTLEECTSLEDKWLHFLKYASEEKEIPSVIQEEPLVSAYKALERYGWSDAEIHAYDDANLAITDSKGALDFSYEEGKKAMQIQIAQNMLKQGLSLQNIVSATGLSAEEIKLLK